MDVDEIWNLVSNNRSLLLRDRVLKVILEHFRPCQFQRMIEYNQVQGSDMVSSSSVFLLNNVADPEASRRLGPATNSLIVDPRYSYSFVSPGEVDFDYSLPVGNNLYCLDNVSIVDSDDLAKELFGSPLKGVAPTSIATPLQVWISISHIFPNLASTGRATAQYRTRNFQTGEVRVMRAIYTLKSPLLVHEQVQDVSHLYSSLLAMPPEIVE